MVFGPPGAGAMRLAAAAACALAGDAACDGTHSNSDGLPPKSAAPSTNRRGAGGWGYSSGVARVAEAICPGCVPPRQRNGHLLMSRR
eukprot:831081-Pyramimonas_sp.AAC.1